MLNKITGCESRTVPPLYVLIPFFFGESQSLEIFREGEGRCGPPTTRHESEDLRIGFSHLCVIMEVCIVAEKRLRRP